MQKEKCQPCVIADEGLHLLFLPLPFVPVSRYNDCIYCCCYCCLINSSFNPLEILETLFIEDAAFRSCLSLIFLPSQQDHCSAEATTIPPPITEPIFIMSAASNQAQDANPHMDLDPKYDDYDFPTTAPEARPGHPGHTTKEQDAQVHQLRAMLEQDGYKERLDTLTLLRFLRARKFNVQLAKEMCGTAPLAR